jgi:hypothetical protein
MAKDRDDWGWWRRAARTPLTRAEVGRVAVRIFPESFLGKYL